jgi:DNA-binding NarL/FixJ family response regulator
MTEDPVISRPRLLIADDNEATRYMFKLLTEAECEVVGEAESGEEAIIAADELRPDVVVMDISMPGMSGLQAARLLRERKPELNIILASQHSDKAYADEALSQGAKGYVLKAAAAAELSVAIREVLAGRIFRSPRVRL